MAISLSGAVSLSTIRTEWGRSGAISMSEMYRGGSHVLSKASDNTGTNDAAGVPTSGVISIGDFRGTAKGFTFTFTFGATNQNASTIFGDDFDVDYPKNIVINSGVELGATSTSEEALEVPSGGAGTITITNNGTLSGAGGAAGADGGDAFEAATNCIFINNGTVRAGGGGGGTGGNGYYSSSSSSTQYSLYSYYWYVSGYSAQIRWNSPYYAFSPSSSATSHSGGGATFYRGTHRGNGYYEITRVSSSTVYTSGGAGGVGQGYGQSAGNGSAGGTNAGTGGAGGSFGASGSTGANGNSSNGSAGGASGKYLRGSSFVTFTNNGTAQGGTA